MLNIFSQLAKPTTITEMLHKYVLPPLCGILLFFNFSQAQSYITLKAAIDTALKNNIQIKVAEINESDQSENLSQARYSQLPSFNATYQGSSNWGRTLDVSTYTYINQQVYLSNSSLNGQLILFQGGLIKNQILANKIQLEIEKGQVKKAKNDLILSVATAYLQVLATQDMVKAALDQQKVAQLNLQSISRMAELGKKTLADIAKGKSLITTANLNSTNANGQMEAAMLVLKQLMEIAPTHNLILERPNIDAYVHLSKEILLNEFYKEALDVNPDIQIAEQQLKASAAGIKIARSAYSPTIALFGSLNSNFSNARQQTTGVQDVGVDTVGYLNGTRLPVIGQKLQYKYSGYPYLKQYSDNLNRALGINLQIPIFNHFSARSAVRKAQNGYNKAELNAMLAKDNLFKILNQAVLDLENANTNYLSSQANFQALKEANAIIKRRYELGLTNILDYQTALTDADKSELDFIQATYNLIFRRKVIDYYLGKPLEL